ncbi:unnamed protein product [Eruca vesicaria subsp. sativa]|uniref:Uncharacterized protein n=1 Tax=Eruca vesicaria subsp. sativa TaxID=29727 RepID=A0ABC8L6B9_ERUVS|nr:unnamed protein product [Eruca vesicaria subsp. sativa]
MHLHSIQHSDSLSRENRNEDGPDKNDELQDLASDVLAKDVNTCVVTKATSVSKDDDRLVPNNTLTETPNGNDDSNYCETRGGVHFDAVSNNISVLKPKEVTTKSVVSPSEKSDPMRRWMEMKENGFLSGPLGGPVASRKRKNKKRGDSSKKRNVVPKKDQKVVVVSNVTTPPSGLLAELKPGILKNVRSKEQVYSFLEALIRNADLNVRDKVLASKLPSTTVSDDHAISFINPEQAVEAATVASQWLEFLHQDFSERISALQDSRNRVDDTLKAELPLLVSSSKESSSANQECTVTEAHRLNWSARFNQFKKHLHDEEQDLEHCLNQVKDMQSQCNEGLRQMNESSCGKDGTNQKTNLAVQAAAASIFSTCRFILSKMKPPPPNSS